MKIRAHHLLCLLHFEGKGYSEEFIKNMQMLKERLEKGEIFELIASPDDICSKCPYLLNETCSKGEDEIKRKDLRIIEYLNLRESAEYNFLHLKEAILRKIKRNIFKELCKDCSWFYLCVNKNIFI
ncbi:MAG: DUF1284 domain-containing protein [Dictyoglomaceae bacterium]